MISVQISIIIIMMMMMIDDVPTVLIDDYPSPTCSVCEDTLVGVCVST